MRLLFGTFATVAMLAPLDCIRAADDPLAYVPANASLFVHVRAGDLWNTALIQEVRKAAAKDLPTYLDEAKDELGLAVDSVDTFTFCFPDMLQIGNDESFVIIVTTKTPFDKSALLKKHRLKDAALKENRVQLEDKFVLQFASDTMFLVTHQSLTERFAKAPAPDGKPGAMTDALKLAREKNHFVFSIDFGKIPAEILSVISTQPETQPFLPLIKSKSTVLFGNVKDKEKEIKFDLHFVTEDANAAQDAEQSFKLLMKLAGNGLATVQKEKTFMKEVGGLLPAFKELERAVNAVKMSRNGSRLDTTLALSTDLPLGPMVVEVVRKIKEESSMGQSTNNLRQLANAMFNYNNQNKGFPPAAICDKKGKPLLSWRVAILPFVGEAKLYNQFKLDEPWDSENNKPLIDKMPKVYLLPGAKSEGTTHYRVFHSNGAVFDPIQQTTIESITDGTSNTVMIVETAEAGPWTKPDDIEFDVKMPIEKLLRFTNDKTGVAFCDGSVRLLKRGLGDKTWRLLIQKADGEPIPDLDE